MHHEIVNGAQAHAIEGNPFIAHYQPRPLGRSIAAHPLHHQPATAWLQAAAQLLAGSQPGFKPQAHIGQIAKQGRILTGAEPAGQQLS